VLDVHDIVAGLVLHAGADRRFVVVVAANRTSVARRFCHERRPSSGQVIGPDIDGYHHRAHSGLNYRTLAESPRPGTMPTQTTNPQGLS
jgi:hypothetical protein